MDRNIVAAWVEGWVVSRGAAPPVVEDWGFTVDVGLPRQVTRHVLPEADEPLLRKLMETVTAPGTWIKTFADPQVLAPWMAPGWEFDDPGFLMTAPLRRHEEAAPLPPGYRLRSWARGGVTRVLVLAADGGFAARGQVALPPGARTAVVDQIETAPAHRRRGLGRVVMRALETAAAGAGATDAVLGATLEGQALYSSLGWATRGPLTGLILRPADPGAGH